MLRIDEVELREFSGMWLNNVKYFKMSVTAMYTLILGRNGSGKSRLIAMLSIMAPAKSDFGLGGGRKLSVTYNNQKYMLVSEHQSKGMVHNIRNLTTGEEVAENINTAHYNELVSDMFQYRAELHELLTGCIGLTTMSKSDRRYWFSQLSESDLSYALKFHAKAKKSLRDLEGAITNYNREIAALKVRVVEDKDEFAALEVRMAELQADMGVIDKELAALGNTTYGDVDLDAVDNTIRNINRTVQRTPIEMPRELIGFDPQAAEHALGMHTANASALLANIEDVSKRIDRARRVRETVDAEAVSDNIVDLRKQIMDIEDTVGMFDFLLGEDEHALYDASMLLKRVLPLAADACRAYNVDFPTDNLSGREAALSSVIIENTEKANRIETGLRGIGAQIQSIKVATSVECPKCSHDFKPGVKDGELEKLIQLDAKWTAALNDLKEKIEADTELLNQYRAIMIAHRGLVDEIQQSDNPVLLAFADVVRGDEGMGPNSVMRIPLLSEFCGVVDKAYSICVLRNKLGTLERQMVIIEATATENVGELQARLDEMRDEYADLQYAIGEINRHKQVYQNYIAYQNTLARCEEELKKAVHLRSDIIDDLFTKEKIAALQEHGRELWGLYCEMKIRFDSMSAAKENLARMESSLSNCITRQTAVSHIVKALSPETGVLAKYLYRGITRVTDLMTAYIGKIWGYQVKICPCDVSDGDLDYKFPYWIDDPEKKLPDVSIGSKGQKQVIDFVFVLAVYRALKLERYPLFVDELGSGFDEGHRSSAINFICEQLDRGQFSQMVMVSHDAATHFQLANADVTVLDPAGISLPKVYNTNVVMH